MTVGQMSLDFNYSDAQGLLVGWVATPITQHSVAPEALLGCVLGELPRVFGSLILTVEVTRHTR